MWAVVGLGNPGREYAWTRHNAGAMFINQLGNTWKSPLKVMDKKFRGAETRRERKHVLLAKSRVFMNMSGTAVERIKEKHHVPLEQLIVAHDDFDIPLGEIRIRRRGGSGTHKGVKSVIEALGTQRFPRIRIGIGPVPEGIDPADFVLSAFIEEEKPLFRETLDKAVQALEIILARSLDEAMNVYNRKRSEV